MENASKALIIAGEILISIMILGLAVYFIANYQHIANSHDKEMSEQVIQAFNANFIKYQNRTDITAQEIVSTIKFVQEHKQKTGEIVQIFIGTSPKQDLLEPGLTQLLKDDIDAIQKDLIDPNKIIQKYYKCDINTGVVFDTTTGKVNRINFSSI